jgi:hypothetical protein
MPWAAQRFATHERCVIVAPQAVKIEVVSKVSTWRKMGVVARVAGQQAGRNRTVNAVMGAVRATARSFGRVMHQLWLEVTGVIFLIMALSFGGAAVKEYGKYHAGQTGPGRAGVAMLFTLAFAWFGLSSFWRVRRKSQRQ